MNKQMFREQSLRKLRALSPTRRYWIDKQINHLLYSYLRERGVRCVMLYVPLGIEVDVSPLIRKLRRDKVEVLVPLMEGESFRLVKYRQPLRTKKYGVKEPKFSKQFRTKKIDIAIVPIVGTDESLRRIGFGKGMYDRFFINEKRWIDEVLFVQRVLCMSDVLITEPHDVKASKVFAA